MAAEQGQGPRRILVGYDGSEGGKDAVALARTLAGGGEHVLLVNVFHHRGAPSLAYRLLTGDEDAELSEFFDPAVAALPGLVVETRTYVGGSPGRILHDIAEDGQCDLVVLGTVQPNGAGRALRGSVARSLLHGSPVPIATAPAGYAASDHRLTKIAVGYDAGEEARAALRYAETLALAGGAAVEVLTVEHPRNPPVAALEYQLDFPEDPKSILQQARAELDPALEVTSRTLSGPTTAAALSEACDEGIDLLCVGSRGYGATARALLGSVAAELLREAACPLLIVPRP
ncbi:MAG TPA: universal stress protein [Solirubrobacterales bacterium]